MIGGEAVLELDRRSLSWRILRALSAGPLEGPGLYERAWELPYRPPSSDNTLYVAVHRLRRQLADTGLRVEIDGEGRYHLGAEGVLELAAPGRQEGPQALQIVGRAAEQEALAGALREGRLVALTGPAGVGKTRLARALLEGDGAWRGAWVSLEGVAPGGLLAAVSRGLGAPPSRPGVGDVEALAWHLAGRPATLLVLDNLERHLEEARGLLPGWLGAAPRLRVLLTSRERSGAPGERVITLAPLGAEQAAALFIERGGLVRAGYRPGAGERAVIAALAARLDGLPLALELAAAQLDVLDPGALLAGLDDRFGLLGGLEAALSSSWARLDDARRAALARCALFSGAFSDRDAAEALGPEVAACLPALRRKSLIQASADPQTGRLRSALLESVRDFLAPRLAADPSLAALRERHRRWTLERGRRASEGLYGPEGLACVDRLGEALADLLALVEDADAGDDEAAEAAVYAGQVLRIRGPAGAHEQLAERALARVDGAGPEWRCRGLLMASEVARVRGRMAESEALLARAEAVGHAGSLAALRYSRGWLAMLSPARWDEATALFEETLALARAQGDRWRAAQCLERLGVLEHWRGRALEGAALLEEAVAALEVLDSPLFLAPALGNLAAAERVLERALAIARSIGAVNLAGQVATNLGNVVLERGELERAAALYREALERLEAVGDTVSAATAEANLGEALAELGRPAEARRHLLRALARQPEGAWRPLWWSGVARCWAAEDAPEQARKAAGRALEEARAVDAAGPLAAALRDAAAVALLAGEREEARELLEEAGGMACTRRDLRLQAELAGLEATLAALEGADEAARWASAVALAEEAGDELLSGRLRAREAAASGAGEGSGPEATLEGRLLRLLARGAG